MHCKHCKQEIRLGPEKHRCAEGDAAAKEKADDRLDAAASCFAPRHTDTQRAAVDHQRLVRQGGRLRQLIAT